MIILLIYLIGIFVTPIILKKYFGFIQEIDDEDDRYMVIITISMIWPLSLVLWLLFVLFSFTVWIYNKV